LLLEQPDILLLDEPTNHLDAETVEWLEHYLANYPGTVILITHDRYFLDNVVGWMLEIERGKATPYKGNYSDYLHARQKMLDTKRQADSRTEKMFQRELEWKSRTPAARAKRAKARLNRFKELQEMRPGQQLESVEFRIPPGPRLGDRVIEVRDLAKSFGNRVLFDKLTFEIPPGGILGVIGANGRGKTTLMRMILGKEAVDSGKIDIGSTVEISYLDQSRTVLDDEKSVWFNITDGNEQLPFDGKTIDSRAFVARFNFKGEDQQKLLGECSGGMRNRVLLAKMLREPANLIILDEPTNDLDLDTMRVLEEAIAEYRGSMIIVSHDRYFLNRVATHMLAFDKTGEVFFHHGDYESYQEWREKLRQERGEGTDSGASKYRKLHRD
jgi:ATPase subunit of ABC transporter with duplicated ATPase domains